jgi:hypothetical protein
VSGGDVWSVFVLGLGGSGQPDPGGGVGGVGESGAVESGVAVAGAVPAPGVGEAELLGGKADGLCCGAARWPCGAGWGCGVAP